MTEAVVYLHPRKRGKDAGSIAECPYCGQKVFESKSPYTPPFVVHRCKGKPA